MCWQSISVPILSAHESNDLENDFIKISYETRLLNILFYFLLFGNIDQFFSINELRPVVKTALNWGSFLQLKEEYIISLDSPPRPTPASDQESSSQSGLNLESPSQGWLKGYS